MDPFEKSLKARYSFPRQIFEDLPVSLQFTVLSRITRGNVKLEANVMISSPLTATPASL
jgi:hypothetical protein